MREQNVRSDSALEGFVKVRRHALTPNRLRNDPILLVLGSSHGIARWNTGPSSSGSVLITIAGHP